MANDATALMVTGDLSDSAIEALARLLIALDDEEQDNATAPLALMSRLAQAMGN